MRRIKTEYAIIGCSASAMLAANHLANQGADFILINPAENFSISDLRPYHGLGLWQSAYRDAKTNSLPQVSDQMLNRLKEIFPAALENTGLNRPEYWSILSSTPIHRSVTEHLEKEFFKLERKKWSSGQFRLVNPETVLARCAQLDLHLSSVAQVEGAIVRSYGLWWDAPQMGMHLNHFIKTKFSERTLSRSSILGKYGRKIVVRVHKGEEVSVESQNGVLIFLTGELLPYIKSIVSSCDETWIQAIRKRRREQHFVYFEKDIQSTSSFSEEPYWMEIGNTQYYFNKRKCYATWAVKSGPDSIERVLDEGLRLNNTSADGSQLVQILREFWLDWDWTAPVWKESSHQTYWATGFEGDLNNMLEVLWNLPLQ